MVRLVPLAGQRDHLGRGRVHCADLGVDALLVRVLLAFFPSVGGGVVAEGRQLGLLVQQIGGAVDRLLPVGDGGVQCLLRAAQSKLLAVLDLLIKEEKLQLS